MATKAQEIKGLFDENSDADAKFVAELWERWSIQRRAKVEEWKEVRDYLFATDTSTTQVGALGWKNSVTLPKLTQLRDNLYANYYSTLFPNRHWLTWEGNSEEDQAKAPAIEAFILNILETSNFYEDVGRLLLDYLDTGNVFATVGFENNTYRARDETIHGYEGPVVVRISPYDHVFDPTAASYASAAKINRSVVSLGELAKMAKEPGGEHWQEALDRTKELRKSFTSYRAVDVDKAIGYSLDGFGSYQEYLSTTNVEVLEYKGDIWDHETYELHENMQIIVIDRAIVVLKEPNPSWAGNRDQVHCPWRKRPDNLYGAGPFDNLVGLQYRMDHLENLKDDALDLAVHPPLVIQGEVDEFTYGPGEEINIIGEGSVTELGKNLQGVMAAESSIDKISNQMEEFAGAPKNAMGIRTPGEKTKFEVQTLEMAASRIFQEKVTAFERNVLEPILNLILIEARQKLSGRTTLRMWNTKYDLEIFQTLDAEDLNGNGSLRPRGARHFAEQALEIQNLTQVSQTPLWQQIAPHMSNLKLAKMLNDTFGWDKWDLIRKNQGLTEAAETESYAGSLQQTVGEQQAAMGGMGNEGGL